MYNDPRLKNKYHAWILISGFDSKPEEITKLLEIIPTETRIKGEYRLVGKGKHERKIINKENSWILKPELAQDIPIEKQIESLLDKINPHKQNFIQIANQYSLELTCAIYYYEANPGINLDKKILKRIAELNIELGFDIYCLAGTVRELEDSNDVRHLENQLSEVKFISKYNNNNNKEVNTFVKSLAGLEKACYNFISFHLPDIIWEGKFSDEEFKSRFEKIGEDLRNIKKYIKESKYLNNLVNKSNKE